MTNYATYSDILKDPNFLDLAAIVRRVAWDKVWQRNHVATPFWELWERVDNVTPIGGVMWNRDQVLAAFVELFAALSDTVFYSEANMTWLVNVLDDEAHRVTIISLWKAYSMAPTDLLTPAEAAAATGTSESGWRNRAAAGDIPGAFKKGKQWLIPAQEVKKILQAEP